MGFEELLSKLEDSDIEYGKMDGKDIIVVNNCEQEDIVERLLKDYNGNTMEVYYSENLTYCEQCNQYVITEYDTGFYTPYDGYCCGDCLKQKGGELQDGGFKDEYLDMLINNPKHFNRNLTDKELLSCGFKKATDNEGKVIAHSMGIYGDEDGVTPQQVLDRLGDTRQVIFQLASHNPYVVEYEYWLKNAE